MTLTRRFSVLLMATALFGGLIMLETGWGDGCAPKDVVSSTTR
jgi:hypothetical protein